MAEYKLISSVRTLWRGLTNERPKGGGAHYLTSSSVRRARRRDRPATVTLACVFALLLLAILLLLSRAAKHNTNDRPEPQRLSAAMGEVSGRLVQKTNTNNQEYYSEFECFGQRVAGSVGINVLGRAFTSHHACLMKNVCVREGSLTLFVKSPEAVTASSDFPDFMSGFTSHHYLNIKERELKSRVEKPTKISKERIDKSQAFFSPRVQHAANNTNANSPKQLPRFVFNRLPHCVFGAAGSVQVVVDREGIDVTLRDAYMHNGSSLTSSSRHGDSEGGQRRPFAFDGQRHEDSIQRSGRRMPRLHRGLTAVVSNSYGQGHITHFMEPLGQLFHYLNGLGYYRGDGHMSPKSLNNIAGSLSSVESSTEAFKYPLFPHANSSSQLVPAHLAQALALKMLHKEADDTNSLHANNQPSSALRRVLLASRGGAHMSHVAKGSFVEYFYNMIRTRDTTNRRGEGTVENDQLNTKPLEPSEPSAAFVSSVDSYEGDCFERILMVGANYNPFQETDISAFYHHRDKHIRGDVERVRRGAQPLLIAQQEEGKAPNYVVIDNSVNEALLENVVEEEQRNGLVNEDDTALSSPGSVNRTIRLPSCRILVAHRTSKRRIANADYLHDWLIKTLPTASSVECAWEVRIVQFGAFATVAESIEAAQWADIMIGIHGADLTNLVFMRPHTAVIELNPLFFFEPRFFLMSRSLGLHYLSWTCTRRSCAGSSELFEAVVPVLNTTTIGRGGEGRPSKESWTYNEDTELISFAPSFVSSMNSDLRAMYGRHTALSRKERHGRHNKLPTQHRATNTNLSLSGQQRHDEAEGDSSFRWPAVVVGEPTCVACNMIQCCTSMQSSLYSSQRESNIYIGTKELEELLEALLYAAKAVLRGTEPSY